MSEKAPSRVNRFLRRRPVLFGMVAVVGLSALTFGLLGGHLRAPQVILGRAWPETELVSIDAIDHRQWDELLHRYVDAAGDVDYAGWKATPGDLGALDEYLNGLSRAEPSLEANRGARLAFWTNAYNAVAVRGVLREYPTKSIQDHVSRLMGFNIWRDLLLQVGTHRYSLGDIEHAVLRKMEEPRIHFAIVCGFRGCPALRKEAYDPGRLESQLRENTSRFFADPSKFSYDMEQRRFRVSPILDWYAEDFGRDEAERLKAIAPYLPDEAARDLARKPGLKLTYPAYDWSLNDQAARSAEAPLPPDAPVAEEEDSP